MTDIFEQLFYGEYAPGDRLTSRTLRMLTERGQPLWDRAYEALGQEKAGELWSNQCAVTRVSSLEAFKEGAFLGVALMLELFCGGAG